MAKRTLLLLGLSVSLNYGLLTIANAQNKHLGSTACQTCHLAGDAVTPDNAYLLIDTQERLCANCHSDALIVSHPSGFLADRILPEEYPVDWKGDLTCSSCHLVHGDNPGLMRGHKRGKALCLSCHDIEFFYQMADGGISVQYGGHLVQPSDPLNEFIDSYSQHCVSCHLDSVSSATGLAGDAGYVLAHGGSTMPHPIGLQYDASKNEKYREPYEISKKIVLPEGNLSCISCHQAYNESHGKLVMSNNGSALCFQCHDM